MTMYGVYSRDYGGIVDFDLYTEKEAEDAIQDRVDDGEDPDDLLVEELCDDHPDRMAANCEECYS